METVTDVVVPLEEHEEAEAHVGVSVIVPAYNEEKAIDSVLENLPRVLVDTDLPYEIIVVDDGSTDHTAEIVSQYSEITLLSHKKNRGYGAALKSGIRHANFDLICITDADGTYPNEQIPQLVKKILNNKCAMVVGSRTGDSVAIPLIRRPAKWAISRLANFVAGDRIPDINSGLRVFRREVVQGFFRLLPDGFSFTTTITLAMWTNGHSVDYININYHKRKGRSKIRPFHDTLNFVQLILRMALYFSPLKIFLPLSAILLGFAVGWGVFSRFVLGQLADVSTLVIAMTGVQVAVVGMLAELINQRLPNSQRKE